MTQKTYNTEDVSEVPMSESQTPRCNTFITTQQQAYEQAAEELTATRAQLDLLRRDNEYLSATLQFLQDENKDLRARLAELEGIAERLRRAVDVSLKAMETAYDRSFTGILRGFMGGKIDEVKAILAYKEGKK